MNRIKISPLATASPKVRPENVSGDFRLDPFDKMAIRTDEDFTSFVPLHYEKNYAYPLIVWLHSDGENSSQLNQILPMASMRNFVGVATQSPVGNFEAGYFWEQEPDTIDFAHDQIVSAVNSARERFNIDSNRIFLAGSGSGGTMAFRIAFERPDLFAGVVSIDGPMPSDERPLVQWADCREVPVFWAHSRRSEAFKQETLCEQLRLLHIAGFSVTLRQYPGENCLTEKTMLDMNSWIMEMIDSSVS